MASDLEKKIITQVEYYFGDINLPRDRFLQSKIKEEDGWIDLDVLLTFKRLQTLSEDPDVIVGALEKTENDLIKLSEDKKKIRRNPDKPCPELNEERRRELTKKTAYAKGFPLDEALDKIITFLESHGPIETCIRRTYKKDDKHHFKGSCFIVFKNFEDCKKFVETESIKYKDLDLIRKFQEDYYTQKKAEIEEHKKAKSEKKLAKQKQNEEKEKPIEIPKGSLLYFSCAEDGQNINITREEIKEKCKDIGGEISYIDFNKGETKGVIRFGEENSAVEFFKKITAGELEVGDIKLKVRVLEGEEEEEHMKKTSEAILKMRRNMKGRKRKGGFNFNHREKISKKE